MYTAEVLKVHGEFNSAGDRLIEAAKAIISKGLIEKSNAKQLIELGFTQCKEAKQYRALEKACKDGQYAEVYYEKYPLNKFITPEQVKRICNKYGLVLGSVDRYMGSIPAKNIKQIISFKAKEEDMEEGLRLFVDWNLSGLMSRWGSLGLSSDIVAPTPTPENKSYNKSLSICAPKKLMNTEGAEIIDGEIVVSDPVVLHPVKGGYLIVTLWGAEASDKDLVNQIDN